MQPYYEHAGITIYHGDCADVIESFGLHWGAKPFDLLLTDPPYGIGRDGQRGQSGPSGSQRGGRKDYEFHGWDEQPPSNELLFACCALARVSIVWGGNYFGLPPKQKWLVWDKGQRIDQSDGELAWTSMSGALRIFNLHRVHLWNDGPSHPTQKPEDLMLWCFTQAPADTQSVFDPFMGSGTTLVAAKRLGRQCVGIEREEKYCEIAAKRLSQEALPLEVA